MPIHEYKCHECNHEFEILTRKLSDVKDEVTCPNCKKIVSERNISSGAFIIYGYNQSNGYDTVMR
ncbi:MAG: zinc ribbon domain-containing protein [Vallitaleaceae bacterium]|nr:zinc ribbon domain-containing protein [Vallitaleaceae bacterium]